MQNKLYVGNLNYRCTADDLRQLFSEFGTVEDSVVITERGTNRSKGFGFVTMKTNEEAQAAVEALDGKDFMDRTLRVNVARPKQE